MDHFLTRNGSSVGQHERLYSGFNGAAQVMSDAMSICFTPSRLLLKREENQKSRQRFRLCDLLRYNVKTVRAYLLNEAFQQLWDHNSPFRAGKFLDEWRRQVMRSRMNR